MQNKVSQIAREAGAEAIAAAFYDYETETAWSYQGDRWFHAASTIKVAVLASLFHVVEGGALTLDARVHVRNRFLSVVDGEPYRIPSESDANSKVHAATGKTMKVAELAYNMIVTSSNLATNLLIDLVGIEASRRALDDLNVEGIRLVRGVEDEKAFDAGINNLVTANGLLRLFRLIQEERGLPPHAAQKMLGILNQQEFNSGIPAGLPSGVRETARVAHKTGEISTVAHDAGIVSLPRRKPYAVAILTEWGKDNPNGRHETIASISRAVYDCLVGDGENA
ncbi:MAG TPA: serine hydrolase [Blastocatellia bacterium]|nr:serine hydrolase [Blastocatellia bacterium]